MWWVETWFSGAGVAVVVCVLNYLFGPWAKARRRRERFFDLAFGHDGSDGLPESTDIFTRVKNVEHVLSNAALLNGKGEALVADVRAMANDLAGFHSETSEAKHLAGNAAAKADTLAKEVRHIQRGVNAIRADLDTYAKAVASDSADIWTTLHSAGLERRDDDRQGT